jgi:hypothetical protein
MPGLASPISYTDFELRFASLSTSGRAFAFPCDSRGNVDIDRLTERLRTSYLFARASVGFELCYPVVYRNDLH